MSKANVLNSNYLWWSFNFTSKNPLSTPLVNKMIYILAAIDSNKKNIFNNVNGLNFSSGQKETLFKYLGINKKFFFYFKDVLYKILKIIFDFTKAIVSIIHIYIFFVNKRALNKKHNILLLTFIDGTNRKKRDPYFGNLLDLIEKENPNKSIGYIYYLYKPFSKMSKILKEEKKSHDSIFSYLTTSDFLWCIIQIFKVYFIKFKEPKFLYKNQIISFKKIVKETILDEISKGVIENLLLFRACKRLRLNKSLEKIIYPFENKPLEKLLLISLSNKIRTVGYQHSSITRRHLSYLLSKEEINITPLPHKIVTLGKITQKWLVNEGNFPSQKIHQGVALRSFYCKSIIKKSFNPKKAKLLFIFSSSLTEVIKTVELLREIPNSQSFIYKFRFHVNFPMRLLEKNIKNWINEKVHYISTDNLYNEFKWAYISLYVSSSAALESLLCCVPVIRLDIDKFNSDPFLNLEPSLKNEVKSSKDLIRSIFKISNFSDYRRNKMTSESKKLLEHYMVPQEKFNSKMFL